MAGNREERSPCRGDFGRRREDLETFLTRHGRPFRKTHDISDFSAQCLEIDLSLDAILTKAEPLTHYAWRFRYPGAPFEPNAADAAAALDTARALLERHRNPAERLLLRRGNRINGLTNHERVGKALEQLNAGPAAIRRARTEVEL